VSPCPLGQVVWLTGLPASGKTTVARVIVEAMRARGEPVLWLDSDQLRTVLTPAPTYSDQEREWFYGVIAHLAKRAADGGVTVVISATAPLRAYRDRARAAIDRFFEIHLFCDAEVLRARDPKHLYERSARGEISRLPGAGSPYEAPLAPELVFDTGLTQERDIAKAIVEHLDRHRTATSE
jgi:adenylylsulfate kinase